MTRGGLRPVMFMLGLAVILAAAGPVRSHPHAASSQPPWDRVDPAQTLIRMPVNTGGPARPLNRGIEEASYELVAILEQDDLMASDRLERQSAAAVRHPECVLIIGRPAIVTERDGTLTWNEGVPPPQDIPQYATHAAGESFVVPSDVAFRSDRKSVV